MTDAGADIINWDLGTDKIPNRDSSHGSGDVCMSPQIGLDDRINARRRGYPWLKTTPLLKTWSGIQDNSKHQKYSLEIILNFRKGWYRINQKWRGHRTRQKTMAAPHMQAVLIKFALIGYFSLKLLFLFVFIKISRSEPSFQLTWTFFVIQLDCVIQSYFSPDWQGLDIYKYGMYKIGTPMEIQHCC